MKITADTNVLVRALVRDDQEQARVADHVLREATAIVVPLTCLCELTWVLRRIYRFTPNDICSALTALLDAANVVTNRPAVEAGLLVLNTGGDFADGVIAHEGHWLGGERFVSFDNKAVELVAAAGLQTRLLVA